MNYPPWEVPLLGGGMLIGTIAILHVFVSHLAVGGGLFLALTERRALRTRDDELLAYVQRHSRFFLLLTVVFGAVSGVGIWFSIGLVHPSATSVLIHTFVWGWAIEWTFFIVEILAILVYYSTWDKLPPKTHNVIGWIYFIAAFMSMVIINGILAFMLTPGRWLETRGFWSGFFNPSYFPSVLIRAAITVALAGVYAIFTGSFLQTDLKARVVRYASVWMMAAIPGLLIGGLWYQFTIPKLSLHIVSGGAPVVMMAAGLSLLFSFLIFPLTYFIGYRHPQAFSPALGTLFLVLALLATAVTEWVREAVRKPYIIYDYMYSNAILKEDIGTFHETGFLPTARWASVQSFDPTNEEETLKAGEALWETQCQHCHTTVGFNGISSLIYGWDEDFLYEQLGQLDQLKKFMPPFVGTDDERRALAKWLATLSPPLAGDRTREAGERDEQEREGRRTADSETQDTRSARDSSTPPPLHASTSRLQKGENDASHE